MPPLPPRGHEVVPQGRKVLYRQVSDRKAQFRSRPARQGPQGQNRRLRSAASRKAEGEAHVLHPGRPVPQLLRAAAAGQGRHRRNAVAATGAPSGQRRLSSGICRGSPSGAPTGASRPRAVNGRKVNIPSFQVHAGDEIAVREKSSKLVVLESAKDSPAIRRRPTGWKSIAMTTRAGCSRCLSAKISTCRSTSS